MERQIASKVDRLEFSQIVSNKANQADLQRLLFELTVAKESMQASEKIQHNEEHVSTESDDEN